MTRRIHTTRKRLHRKRGVILLVILSLLVLFALLGVTFAIVAGQYRKAAKSSGNYQRFEDEGERLTNQVMYMLLREPRDARSALFGNSLLRDMYGTERAYGQVTDAQVSPNVPGLPPDLMRVTATASNAAFPLSNYIGAFNGCVLTFTNGQAMGQSTRVVNYFPPGSYPGQPNGYVFVVERLGSDTVSGSVLPQAGSAFIVNGKPFNSTGFGYDPASGNLTKVDPNLQAQGISAPLALLPNHSMIPVPLSDLIGTLNLPNYNGGDADESYDGIDYNNPFLAGEFPNNAAGGDYRILDSSQISPSFHNRALVNYWMQKLSSNPAQLQAVLRRAMFRPLPTDHPNFTGSNNVFTAGVTGGNLQVLVNGPWDVDNDGDGVTDSVWIDVAFPPQRTKEGRLIKPLVAIKVLDLGGRANVNANGHLAHLDSSFYSQIASGGQVPGAAGNISVTRGQGYGPPEVYLQPLLNTDQNRVIANRYLSTGQPGQSNYDDYLSQLMTEGVPNIYPDVNVPTNYANPPDFRGRGAIVMNMAGLPVSVYAGTSGSISVDVDGPGPQAAQNVTITETVDDPYELNLVSPGMYDRKYTPAEFERYLRYFDADAVALPSRLVGASGSALLADPTLRNALTTESFDVPVPHALRGPQAQGLTQKMYSGPYELMVARLQANSITDMAQINLQMSRMFPFELLHGQKMNLNRAWGNGVDNTPNAQTPGYSTVDEPREVASTAQQHYPNVPNYTVNGDYLNSVQISTTSTAADARQLYARHLYVMAMMLVDDNFLSNLPSAENLNQQQKHELAAQRLAQWAVNVVDFRDPDSIMTTFEYDVNPFNGWQVDGDLTTDGVNSQEKLVGADGSPQLTSTTDRRYVFGCEAPDLLITENISFHDRRVRDTEWDNASDNNGEPPGQPGKKRLDMATMKMGDKDLDQFRIPEGNTYVELFCTGPRSAGTATTPMVPRELYNIANNGTTSLDLGRMAPSNGTYAVPVWRMAVSERLDTYGLNPQQAPYKSALQLTTLASDRVSFQPEAMNQVYNDPQNPQPQNVYVERIVWFANQQPPAAYVTAENNNPARPVQIYYNRLNASQLPAGSYAVVGPRATTHIGSQTDRMKDSPQAITLTANSIAVTDTAAAANNNPPAGRPVLGIIAAADAPTAWTNAGVTAPQGIGFSISEPLPIKKYYKEPTHKLSYATATDAYVDPDAPTDFCPDTPEDASDNTYPLGADPQLRKTGTRTDFRSVYLQRLADPTLPWNPLPGHPAFNNALPVNPYITVDWSTMDLTVFNGEDRKPSTWDENMPAGIGKWTHQTQPDDEDPITSAPDERFSTRQRGDIQFATAPDIYAPRTTTPPVSQADTAAADPTLYYFNHKLVHSLGSLNSTYGNYLNAPPLHVGDPQNGPHPWMAWNNRPYANHMELLLVPSSSPGRLLHEYSQLIGVAAAANAPLIGANPYQINSSNVTNFKAPYGHLLNFFHSTEAKNPSNSGANLARLLDLVEVPSRFVGTEKFYQPTFFTANNPLTATYKPPFAKLSRFRDPGKININTVTDPRVWQAISYGYPDTTTNQFWNIWSKIDTSRKQLPGNSAVLPTEFANPVRSASAGELVPLIGQSGEPDMRVDGVQASLLRADPSDVNRPLFSLGANEAVEQYRNHLRNPYFRYQGLQKIGNIVGTQSNTFAVWVTVGYFELEPNNSVAGGPPVVDAAHPDGYRLGQEVGADNGMIKRHRAFYMIDRSIPVGFEPGENHNVDRAILLRRFIE